MRGSRVTATTGRFRLGVVGMVREYDTPRRNGQPARQVFILTGASLFTPYGFDTGLIRGLAGWSAMFTGYGFFAHFLLESPPTPPHPPYTHIEYRYRYRYRCVGGWGVGWWYPPPIEATRQKTRNP
jgi:hypothetical protein